MNDKSTINADGLQLYHSVTCLFCFRVRIAFWMIGFKVKMKNVLFPFSNSAELIAGGGSPQVPCLRIEKENGTVQWLYESGDIVRFAKNLNRIQGTSD